MAGASVISGVSVPVGNNTFGVAVPTIYVIAPVAPFSDAVVFVIVPDVVPSLPFDKYLEKIICCCTILFCKIHSIRYFFFKKTLNVVGFDVKTILLVSDNGL